MKDFNAQQARQIVDSLSDNELHDVLADIKIKAEQGETVLHLYKTISNKSADALRSRGFKVTEHSSIAIQRDGLYFSIHWDAKSGQ